MRIAIITIGTRGDVQPYIALGQGLMVAGHTVRLATHKDFEELVKSYGRIGKRKKKAVHGYFDPIAV